MSIWLNKAKHYKHKNFIFIYKDGLRNFNVEIEKKNYHYKSPFPLSEVDIEKFLGSNKIYCGEENYNAS